MRSKEAIVFYCPSCGVESSQWMGFCSHCGSDQPLLTVPRRNVGGSSWVISEARPQLLSEIPWDINPRIVLSYPELNRVLGGGIVPGSILLLAGDPGVGKSTLLLQIAEALCSSFESADWSSDHRIVLYVSGEESGAQIRMRADRLGVSGSGLNLLAEMNVENLFGQLAQMAVGALVVDSIQTMFCDSVDSPAGSVNQVRECARLLIGWAKSNHIPILLAGHVTKDGSVAGPRILEHMVDVVLYLEDQNLGDLRLLRSVKNRFGSTNEVAIFEMGREGLSEVADPSNLLLPRSRRSRIGSMIVPILEGTSPLLLEVQALTTPTHSPIPRRVTNGIEVSRLVMLAAVLDRQFGLSLGGYDIIVNVVGGFQVNEPAMDLGIALAVASSFWNAPVAQNVVAIGEVGLTGEIRPVTHLGKRVQAAVRLGFDKAILCAQGLNLSDTEFSEHMYQAVDLAQAFELTFSHRMGRSEN